MDSKPEVSVLCFSLSKQVAPFVRMSQTYVQSTIKSEGSLADGGQTYLPFANKSKYIFAEVTNIRVKSQIVT
jgi:hypothetical protein